MPFSRGCIATPSILVLLIPWFGWRLRMVIFQFGTFYSSLESRGVEPFPHSTVWNSWAPVRASFFAWEAT